MGGPFFDVGFCLAHVAETAAFPSEADFEVGLGLTPSRIVVHIHRSRMERVGLALGKEQALLFWCPFSGLAQWLAS